MKTTMLSETLKQDPMYKVVRNYALRWIRNPDPGSIFEQRTADIIHLPDSELLKWAKSNRYDMLVGYDFHEICGHFAFQEHDNNLHVFSFSIESEYRGNKLSVVIARIDRYARINGLNGAVISLGQNEESSRLFRFLVEKKKN